MGADPDHDADRANDAPKREHGAPVGQTSDAGAATAAAAGASLFLFRARRGFVSRAATCVARLLRRTADAVLRDHTKIKALGGAGALAAVSPGHVPSPARVLEHDPEKWEAVFRKDHAPQKIWRVAATVDGAL